MDPSEKPSNDAPHEPDAPRPAETARQVESTSMPTWVKVSGVVMIVFVAAVLAFHLSGNGMGGMHG